MGWSYEREKLEKKKFEAQARRDLNRGPPNPIVALTDTKKKIIRPLNLNGFIVQHIVD